MGTSMRKKHISSFQIIIFGFFMVIFIGSLILMLPWATQSGQSASFADALFTSTSAVCVTGLIVQDTATYWSEFGQFIILILIQKPDIRINNSKIYKIVFKSLKNK